MATNTPLTFTAVEANGTIKLNRVSNPAVLNLEYSTDGSTWQTFTVGTTYTLANVGDYMMLRAPEGNPNTQGCGQTIGNLHQFIITGRVNVSGNVMSLYDKDATTTAVGDYGLKNLFVNCKDSTFEGLEMPATSVGVMGYDSMFYQCSSLTQAPLLPATTIAVSCYNNMFYRCTSLSAAPEILPATTLQNFCYNNMFNGCSSLTAAPELPATTLAGACYNNMFNGCASLSTAPATLPATTLPGSCYKSMFDSCSSLTAAPYIPPAAVTGTNALESMFNKCTSLVNVQSSLSVTGKYQYTFQNMFNTCSSLTAVPALYFQNGQGACQGMFSGCRSVQSVGDITCAGCSNNMFRFMFDGCSSFVDAPTIYNKDDQTGDITLNTYVASSSHEGMFRNCTSLSAGPQLPATTLVSNCYRQMFNGCSGLNYVKTSMTATQLAGGLYTSNWLSGVAPTGTFYYTDPNFDTSIARSVNTVPEGWTIEKYTNPFKKFFIDDKEVSELFIDGTEVKITDAPLALKGLAFKANADNSSVQLNKIGNPVDVNLEYAVNSAKDEDFQPYTVGTAISLDEGDIMLLRAPEGSSNLSGMGQSAGAKHKFTMTGSIAASGNIMRLYDKDGETSTITNWGFSELFHDCTALTEGPGSTATSIGQGAYHQLFMGCSNMVRVGTFADATATGIYAYGQTFSGCSSLTAVQDKFDAGLDSGQSGTFAQAFENCVSLLHAPSLRFRNGEKACQKTFQGCTSIVDAGDISCVGCTNYMFQFMYDGCSALAAPPMFYHEDPTTHEISDQYTAASHSHGFLFRGCSSMASVPNFKITTYANRADYTFEHLFDGCTSLVDASGFVMPTTYSSGAEAMLQNLFDGCTSLTAAPEIPSYNLGPYAFQYAFRNCTALTEAPELPSTTLARTCYSSMFQGCTSLEKPPQFYGPITGLSQNCMQNMFNGCTSLTSTPAIDETAVQSVSNNSHADMFARCSALVDASGIKLSKVAYEYGNSCYAEMFLDCTNLSVAPAEVCINGGSYTSRAGSMFRHCQGLKNTPLIISNPRQYDMNVMFEGCQNLEEVHFDGVFTGTGTTNWLSGVAPTGTFYYYDDSFVIPTERDASHVPAGWTIERAQA